MEALASTEEVAECIDDPSQPDHVKTKDHEELKRENEELKLKCAQLEVDNAERTKENKVLEERLKLATYDEDSFHNNDEKVYFFTGLANWETPEWN